MWFKYGLKAQKLLAQGIALGIVAVSKAPCKGKSLIYCPVFKSFCPARACGGETCETSVFQRKRQFLTKLPLSLVFHKQKCIKTAYL